jgi:hypothetical protein
LEELCPIATTNGTKRSLLKMKEMIIELKLSYLNDEFLPNFLNNRIDL